MTVTKIKDFTHVVKIEFGAVEAAEKSDGEGTSSLLYQMTGGEFDSLTCFNCYR